MSVVSIGEAVTGGALRATHFFNGRLLTGEDLDHEQQLQASRLARLGTAIGDGVVDGLRVTVPAGSTAARPLVTVSPGLAVARSGAALELAEEVDVSLAAHGPTPGSEPGGLFAPCQPYLPSEYSTGVGVYLLSIGPKSQDEGLAPVSGLHNTDAPCDTAYEVEGVSFRRVRLRLPLSELDDRERLRNVAAYRIFAPAAVARLASDPFGTPLTDYGLLDELRPAYLHDDEVPLALIGWEAGEGIRFIDHWSVRRRLTRRTAPDALGTLVSDRLLAEGEARFLQFQEHVDDLRRGTPPARSLVAGTRFARLPAAGLLPLAGSTDARGFDALRFFAGMAVPREVHVEGAQLPSLIHESFAYPPVAVDSGEAVRLYVVRENVQAAARPYLVFASAQLAYRADARLNLAHWDLANYAERH